jgi:quinol monooxygenase YgiN
MTQRYVYLWAFEVVDGQREAFVAHYGPDGSWARLFARADGYLGTQLLVDPTQPSRFVTIDQWCSAAHFAAFKARFGAEYAALDAACEPLAASEVSLGSYLVASASAAAAAVDSTAGRASHSP